MAVFITGASSGLGAALAKQYALQGHTLGLLARRRDRLHELASSLPGRHYLYVVDVQDRAELHAAAYNFIEQVGEVDVVIACAGISAGTLTEEADDFAVFKAIFETNVMATVSTFEPFVPQMIKRRAGTLVGIASVAGVRGLPGAGAYSASKSAVTTYCESLRLELKPHHVGVVTIAPGFIRTEMTEKNPYHMPFLMDAEEFAVRALVAIQQKKSYVVIPWQMGVVGKLLRLLPNWLYDRLAVNGPRKPRKAG
ncbi:MAG: SDR family oxidoreductase [Candidatus Methylopumilus sp.]|nr:SDR family oxidoreductase [Candidatus Methylopumilus sp.]